MAAVVGFVVPIVDLAAAVEVEPTNIPIKLKFDLVFGIYSNNILFETCGNDPSNH